MLDESQENIAPTARDPLRVFISYWVTPDAPLAVALKRLVEGAIEPQPEVFVSGEGGARPSNVGFKPQIQNAARRSHAFVSIITNASKDREWIYFEAGAAWGQDLMYAPVLIVTQPKDLPSSIGDYQAVRGQAKDDMQRLMEELAARTGAIVKDRFGSRFLTFSKAVDEYLNGNDGRENDRESDDLSEAYRLAATGQTERANDLFDELESAASSDIEQLCRIKIQRIWSLTKPETWREQYSKIDETLKTSTIYHYVVADETDHPLDQAKHLDRAVQIGKGTAAKLARLALARNYAKRGYLSKAIAFLFKIVQDEHNRGDESNLKLSAIAFLFKIVQDEHGNKFSEDAAKSINDIPNNLKPNERLLVFLAGLTGRHAEGYQKVAELAFENKWNALCLYCRNKVNGLDETSHSVNELGRIQSNLELHSLAYNSFSRAADLGATVALCNMAQSFLYHPIPAAGLKLFVQHNGGFDSLDKGFPYEIRAELERGVQEEEDKQAKLLKLGQKQFEALWEIASYAISASKTDVEKRITGQLSSNTLVVKVSDGQIALAKESNITVEALKPFGNALQFISNNSILLSGGDLTGFITFRDGNALGLIFNDFASGEGLEWCSWEGQPSPPQISSNSFGNERTLNAYSGNEPKSLSTSEPLQ